MSSKVLEFKKDEKTYQKIVDKCLEKGEYDRALTMLYSALLTSKNPVQIYADLAETYSMMTKYDKALEYWFRYLDCAKEEEKSIAYEGLAINYFYLDKFFEAGYYLHKKIVKDGFISREELGEEIAEVMLDGTDKLDSYHIAYPFDRADYSYEKKLGKKAFALGDFRSASNIFDSIPQCRQKLCV